MIDETAIANNVAFVKAEIIRAAEEARLDRKLDA